MTASTSGGHNAMHHVKRVIHCLNEDRQPFSVWVFFILLEIALYLMGAIRLDLALNLLFVLFVLLPMPRLFARYRSVQIGRFTVTLLLAVLLLWHQSWLPTPAQTLDLLVLYGLPSTDYMLAFIDRMLTMSTLLSLIILAAISFLLSKKRLVGIAVLPIALVVAPFISAQLIDSDETYSMVGISVAEAADMDPGR
jgi:hypothetical protein